MTQDLKEKKHFKAATKKGEFIRVDSGFRNWVTADGSPGPSGVGGFKAEKGRYHLYLSWACPWANRTQIFRSLKGLEDYITMDFVHPLMGSESWHFGDYPNSTPDSQHGSAFMKDLYHMADPDFNGVVTVPVLWDKHNNTIVSNESSEIIRMFNSAFDDLTGNTDDYYPEALRAEIDEINECFYNSLNNGVYRSGFATTQVAYESAVNELFDTLDYLEARLEGQDWLVANTPTESDWRLFPTLIRFDPVYVGHFKCNRKRIIDYPNLWRYTRQLYAVKGVSDTIDMQQIKYHYYASHKSVNPTGIVPAGPNLDYSL